VIRENTVQHQKVKKEAKQKQIILIDNFDSFTYNLVNQLRLLDYQVKVFRNDVAIKSIFTKEQLDPENKQTIIVLSPGPGNPNTAGNSLEIINTYAGILPILGICLGHQSIVQHYSGSIKKAKQVRHAKADEITLTESPIFKGINSPLKVARYHSLIGTDIPKNLSVIAQCEDEVMAVQNKQDKVLGFQFHPESILTTQGAQLLNSSLKWLAEG
jgi:anthranilate synthase component II